MATLHRDPYEVLIRKIGYSVGLEATRERARDLAELYATSGGLSSTDWSELVKSRWNLSTDHIAKVFAELNLVRVQPGAIDTLYGLDALGILWKQLTPTEFEPALDAVLTALILIADADIFLNCMAGNFETEDCEGLLLSMIHDKRTDAHKAIRLSGLREKVDRVINIEVQKTNKGGALAAKGIDALKRTTALESKLGPLQKPQSDVPTISADYLRKVPPRRRDWARSVGLFEEDTRTPLGNKLLEAFSHAGCRYPDGAYTLWPL